MALALNDRVQETGTANTTVSFTLTGATAGFQSFAVVGNTNTTYYAATDASGNWEAGVGTYATAGPTLTRTTILASSNSGSAVSTFSGTLNIFVTYPAERAVYSDGTNLVGPSGIALQIGSGGTGQTTQAAALTALAGAQTSGRYLRSDGTNTSLATIQAGDVPTLNQNTTGTASNVTGTVAIANGGTGQTAQQAALTALSGTQTSGQYLRSNGTNTLLSAIQAADVPTLNQSTTGQAGKVANALTAGTGITFSSGTTYDGSAAITVSVGASGASLGTVVTTAQGWNMQ